MEDFDEFIGRDLKLFGIQPEFIEKLKWMDKFVKEEVEPLDTFGFSPYDTTHPARAALFPPLQQKVRDQGLWACHLGPELGGPGYGQFKLACMNLILGRSRCAPKVFGTAAPDTGNSEILAHYGTPKQKKEFLEPLLQDKISSCYSMTEPAGGADPTTFVSRAELDPDTNEWVINGAKLWSSSAKYAAFFLMMAVTDPEASRHSSMSMFIIPATTPGVTILRNVGTGIHELDLHDPERGLPGGDHGYVEYKNVRVPFDHLLGRRGEGFLVAQTRLSGGRIHYGMRTIGTCKRAFDMMCERAQSRTTQGEKLALKQMTQEKVADCWMALEQFKLLVLRTAWLIDENPKNYRAVRKDIAAVKAMVPKVIDIVVTHAMRLHGGLGVSWELPFTRYLMSGHVQGIADGPTEVHKVTIARQVLAKYVNRAAKTQDEINFTPYNVIALHHKALEKYRPHLQQAGVDEKWVTRGPGLNSIFATESFRSHL